MSKRKDFSTLCKNSFLVSKYAASSSFYLELSQGVLVPFAAFATRATPYIRADPQQIGQAEAASN